MTELRATLAGRINDSPIALEVSGDLYDRFRTLRVALGQSEDDMLRWLTDGGRILATERQVKVFVEALEGRKLYPNSPDGQSG